MSKRINPENPTNTKRTIPEILRSISHKFRAAIRTQDQNKATPPEMRTRKTEQYKDK